MSGHTKPPQAPGQRAHASGGGARAPATPEGEGARGGTGAADAGKGAWGTRGAQAAGAPCPPPARRAPPKRPKRRGGGPRRPRTRRGAGVPAGGRGKRQGVQTKWARAGAPPHCPAGARAGGLPPNDREWGRRRRGREMPRRGKPRSHRTAAAPRQREATRDKTSTRGARDAGALDGGRAADTRPTGECRLHVPRRLCPRARAIKGGRVGRPRDPPHGKSAGQGRGSSTHGARTRALPRCSARLSPCRTRCRVGRARGLNVAVRMVSGVRERAEG